MHATRRLPQLLALALTLVIAFPLSALADNDARKDREENNQPDSYHQSQSEDPAHSHGDRDSATRGDDKVQENQDSARDGSAKADSGQDSVSGQGGNANAARDGQKHSEGSDTKVQGSRDPAPDGSDKTEDRHGVGDHNGNGAGDGQKHSEGSDTRVQGSRDPAPDGSDKTEGRRGVGDHNGNGAGDGQKHSEGSDTRVQGNHDPERGTSAKVEEDEQVRREHVKDRSLEEAHKLRQEGDEEHYLTFVNGQRVALTPQDHDGRLLVPFRRLAEYLGATVAWDPAGNAVTMTLGSTAVQLIIGADTALVNGQLVPLQVPAQIDNGRTFVPLRFIAEALGATVGYDPATGAVTVITGATPATGTAAPAPAAPATDTATTPAPTAPAPATDTAAPAAPAAPATGTAAPTAPAPVAP